MGFTPAQVNEMSMWQWFSALHGYIAANSPKQGNKLTADEKADLWADIEAYGGVSALVVSTQTYWLEGEQLVPAGIVTFEVQ